MIVNSIRPILGALTRTWVPLVPAAIYIICIAWFDILYHFEDWHLPAGIVTTPGTVIALLLAFRTNSCYMRWWEARIIWGGIVNESRTWVRQLIQFTAPHDNSGETPPPVVRMSKRQIAWCYALTHSLRRQHALHGVQHLIGDAERHELATQSNVPNALLLKQARELRALYNDQQLTTYQFVELERTLTRLTDCMGRCERIKNTPFPASYRHLVTALIYLFIVLLPFGLVDAPAFILSFYSLCIASAFLVIDRVSIYLEDPFDNRVSDTPMLSLSRTIEINILEMLGEDDLPKPLTPVGGVLM